MRYFMVGAWLLLGACEVGELGEGNEGGSDEGGSDEGGGGGGGTDTSVTGTCNAAHELCAPGVAGCGGEGSSMLPGADCLACHKAGGGEAPKWTAGGTIFTDADGTAPSSNAKIVITDAKGNTITMTSNGAGNFYTTKAISFPINVDVTKGGQTVSMGTAVDSGGCNACHSCTGEAGGKLYQP